MIPELILYVLKKIQENKYEKVAMTLRNIVRGEKLCI